MEQQKQNFQFEVCFPLEGNFFSENNFLLDMIRVLDYQKFSKFHLFCFFAEECIDDEKELFIHNHEYILGENNN